MGMKYSVSVDGRPVAYHDELEDAQRDAEARFAAGVEVIVVEYHDGPVAANAYYFDTTDGWVKTLGPEARPRDS